MSRNALHQNITIDELGGRGDGIATVNGKKIYIPYSAPGDVADIKLSGSKGRLRHIHKKSEHRIDPACQHFTKCGGCSLQHIEQDFYKDWKVGHIRTALKNHGLDGVHIGPVHMSPPASRRRTTVHAIGRGQGKVVLGYAEKASHNLIDVEMCPILRPEIIRFLKPLKVFLSPHLEKGDKMAVAVTAGDNGLDVVLKGKGDIDLNMRMDIATFADNNDLARISWHDVSAKKPYYELLAERRKPYITIEGNKIFFPEGAFLQATEPGQNTLVSIMLDAIQGSGKVLDLFSGCGTFSVAAVKDANVHAVENNESMFSALKQSANQMDGIKQMTTELRDLFLRPMLPHELDEYDVAVIDPPRVGAHQQIEEVVNSDLEKVVMVSCNPLTFSRDASALVKAGFEMGTVIPVDQFLYSSHLEVITTFTRS